MNDKYPKLILLGAGPGDVDLITMKGVKALKCADVILYDALVNEDLLSYARPGAKIIFVGKRVGLHHYQQFKINQLIVQNARKYGTVVRLKGGDPYVFGRGHEEMEYALKHGVEVEMIPGVTSAISVPALQQIPLTKRGICQSFTVVTATNRNGELGIDLQWAATGTSTVVILMGTKKLSEIVTLFTTHRTAEEPVAIIQNGSTSKEKMVVSDLKNIQEKAVTHKIGAPAIIIIGQVVKERSKITELLNPHSAIAFGYKP